MSRDSEQTVIVAGLIALLAALLFLPDWVDAWDQYKRALIYSWGYR